MVLLVIVAVVVIVVIALPFDIVVLVDAAAAAVLFFSTTSSLTARDGVLGIVLSPPPTWHAPEMFGAREHFDISTPLQRSCQWIDARPRESPEAA